MKLISLVEADGDLRRAGRSVAAAADGDFSQLASFLQGLVRVGRVDTMDLQLLVLCGVPGVEGFLESIGVEPVECPDNPGDFIEDMLMDPQLVRWAIVEDLLRSGFLLDKDVKSLGGVSDDFVYPISVEVLRPYFKRAQRYANTVGGYGMEVGLFLLRQDPMELSAVRNYFYDYSLERLRRLFLLSAFRLDDFPGELRVLVR